MFGLLSAGRVLMGVWVRGRVNFYFYVKEERGEGEGEGDRE